MAIGDYSGHRKYILHQLCHLSYDKVPTQHPVSLIFRNLWSSELKGMIVLGKMTLIYAPLKIGALIFIMLSDSEAKTLLSCFPPFDKCDLYWASVYKLARINLITCFLIPGDKGDL